MNTDVKTYCLFINTCLFGIHVEFLSSHGNLFVSLCGFAIICRNRTKQQQHNYSHVGVVLNRLWEKEERPQKMANMLKRTSRILHNHFSAQMTTRQWNIHDSRGLQNAGLHNADERLNNYMQIGALYILVFMCKPK